MYAFALTWHFVLHFSRRTPFAVVQTKVVLPLEAMAAAEGSSPPAVGGGREIAIPFIVTETDDHGKERFVVTQEAIDYLSTLTGRLAVVTIAGACRECR